MKTAIIPISETSREITDKLVLALHAKVIKRRSVGRLWKHYDSFVFIGAMGICVRTIAPYVKDKHTDPAVVCIDSFGRHVVSVLSGHIGGANDLTQYLSTLLSAEPVITTQSDLAGLWALDTLADRYGWKEVSFGLNDLIASFVNGRPMALLLEAHDDGTDYLEATRPPHVTIVHSLQKIIEGDYEGAIIVTNEYKDEYMKIEVDHIVYMQTVSVGFGLAHQAGPADELFEEIRLKLIDLGINPFYTRWYTIDIKRNEPFVRSLRRRDHNVDFFTADQLAAVSVPTPSEVVQKHVGTPSVCEAAAILGAHHGELIVEKVKGSNYTFAVAIDRARRRQSRALGGFAAEDRQSHALGGFAAEGHIEIVGAGPGDPDLVSVRGRKMLERADLILYAGSLVPKALTECHKPGATVRSSADMALEEQCALMKQFYDQGKFIVRLHTGDPCIFGAIQEQMAFFDRNGMSYHITPGISSFLAAAAELRSQFTIPEKTQTIILTRGEGRTPMPEREQLHLLARSQSTMCIFLSAAIVDDVQRELLQEYPEDTPVAACYHLTWPDQKIYRGVLKDLAKMVHDNHLTLTTMLVVGEAIDNREGLSALYDRHFTHLFRQGED